VENTLIVSEMMMMMMSALY